MKALSLLLLLASACVGASKHRPQASWLRQLRQIQEKPLTTLQKIDQQMEMLNDEMEDLQEQKKELVAAGQSTADVDHLTETVQGQIDFVLKERAAELAAQQAQANATLNEEAYEAVEEEEEKLEEEVFELGREEHWTRYLLYALFGLGGAWTLWVKHKGRAVQRPIYQSVSSRDDSVSELEMETQ